MQLIPAIDIRGGLCVRLYQGDYDRQTVYSDNPLEVALNWESLGATRIHIVDLDGAQSGIQSNIDTIQSIVKSLTIPIQVGGGIRNIDKIRSLLDAGVNRVILGTIAISDPDIVEKGCNEFGSDSIIVGLDARNGLIPIKGWEESSNIDAKTLLARMETLGVNRFVYTDIAKDGTLEGPNFTSVKELIIGSESKIIASGGVSDLEHLLKLSYLGAEAAIVGQALYTGNISVRDALEYGEIT